MTNGNDPAMPLVSDGYTYPGLTKRELIAAMALQGMLANPTSNNPSPTGRSIKDVLVEASVVVADALITELNNPHP